MMSGVPSSLWAHPPLPPGKRLSDRSSFEDKRSSSFGFMRKFPSVRRRNSKKDNMADTTYESFDSLFEDNDIMLIETEYLHVDDSNRNRTKKRPLASMFRSRSDGNLSASCSSTCSMSGSSVYSTTAEPKGLSKYLRALSGSWKNLLNSKCTIVQVHRHNIIM